MSDYLQKEYEKYRARASIMPDTITMPEKPVDYGLNPEYIIPGPPPVQQDKTAQANALGTIWNAIKSRPPSWSIDVMLSPFVVELMKREGFQAAKDIKGYAENEIKYMLPNPYERLINEAVNRHISKSKK